LLFDAGKSLKSNVVLLISQQSDFEMVVKFVLVSTASSSQQFISDLLSFLVQQSSSATNDNFEAPVLTQDILLMVKPRLDSKNTKANDKDVIFCMTFIRFAKLIKKEWKFKYQIIMPKKLTLQFK
jgi:hypothetical protein